MLSSFERRLENQLGLLVTVILIVAMFSGVLVDLARPGGFVFISFPFVLNKFVHLNYKLRPGTGYFNACQNAHESYTVP